MGEDITTKHLMRNVITELIWYFPEVHNIFYIRLICKYAWQHVYVSIYTGITRVVCWNDDPVPESGTFAEVFNCNPRNILTVTAMSFSLRFMHPQNRGRVGPKAIVCIPLNIVLYILKCYTARPITAMDAHRTTVDNCVHPTFAPEWMAHKNALTLKFPHATHVICIRETR